MGNDIKPIPDSPQERFLQSSVRELGFGGQAGGSKSFSLILDALYQIGIEDYNALLLRRTYKQLSGADGLIELSRKVYPKVGGIYIKSEHLWTFRDYPGTIRFGHLENENDLEQNHEGHQYAYIGFDELQTFTERMYLYLFSRNRSSNPKVKSFIRSTFMPGGIGHKWVKKRFIDSHIKNVVKYFRRINGTDTETGTYDQMATARMFIPSRLEDNPFLYLDGAGDYEKGLHQLDDVDFRRKRLGDWDIQRSGLVYHAFKNVGPLSTELDYTKASGYYHANDFGAVNEAFGLFVKIEDKYYLIYEAILPEGTTERRAELMKAHFAGRKIVGGWGGAPSEKQQRLDYSAKGIAIRQPPIDDVESQIRLANNMLDNGTLVICSDMTQTIDQLENCVRDAKEGIQDKSIWHHLDVLRYFATGISRRGSFVG